jgi:hypothetical protein
MALKPDRIELLTDVSFFMTSIPAGSTYVERGGVACVVAATSGVGVSMDDGNAVVAYSASSSGVNAKPVGILLNDVVNLDLTRQHINWHKDETQVGGKVTLLRVGQVTTNMLVAGTTPSAGADAYVGVSGLIGTSSTNAVKVGQFLSAKDTDGYAKVSVNL